MLQKKNLLTDKDALMAMKVDELRTLCKYKQISYYENGKRLAKEPMVDRIVDVMERRLSSIPDKFLNAGENEEYEAVEHKNVLRKEQEAADQVKRLEKKKRYIEQAEIGTIVAFKLPSGKVISAAITRKSTKARKFMVQTKYGVEHKISFDDVIWVKTNERWPRGIYLLFKQNVDAEVTDNGKEVS